MPQQGIGAVHVAGVDGRHDKGRSPAAQRLVKLRLGRRRLGRAGEAGRQRKGVAQQLVDLRIGLGGCQCRLEAGSGTAREGAFHLAYAALDPGQSGAKLFLCRLLQEVHAQVEGDGIKTAGEDDTRAALLGGLAMGINHLAHPCRLTAQVDVVGAGFRADTYQVRAIQLVGANGGQHHAGALCHRAQAVGVAGVSNHQRGVGRGIDLIANGFQFALAAARHGPAQAAVVGVLLAQVFCNQTAGVAGGAVDDDVKLWRTAHAGCPPGGRGTAAELCVMRASPSQCGCLSFKLVWHRLRSRVERSHRFLRGEWRSIIRSHDGQHL